MANLQDITNRSEVGTIKPWGKATAPAGYLLCDGSAVSRTTYADLFTVISTTYGVGTVQQLLMCQIYKVSFHKVKVVLRAWQELAVLTQSQSL